MIRIALALALALALTGCDNIRAGFTPLDEKVNAAQPLPDELALAANRLLASLEGDAPARTRVTADYEQRLQARALACSGAAGIGRFDSAATVRRKLVDVACFREHDARLADWIGLRRVALLAAAPPLVAAAPLPARMTLAAKEPAQHVALASAANVAVLRGTRNVYTTLELPTGKVLGTFESLGDGWRAGTLSPNGRVLAVPASGSALRLVDAVTGNVLWSSDKHTELLAWLPQVEAALLTQKERGAPALLDLRRGTLEPYAVPLSRLQWAVPVPGDGSRFALSDAQSVVVAGHARAADGTVEVAAGGQWRLAPGRHAGSQQVPMLMKGASRLVYIGNADLGWLDLRSGEQGTWDFQPIQASGFSKLDDTRIYLEATVGQPGMRRPFVFDVDSATLTPAQADAGEGSVQPLAARDGYARRGGAVVNIATAATADGDARPLATVVGEADLQRQLAKLEASRIEAGRLELVRPALAVPAAVGQGDVRVSIVGIYEGAGAGASRQGVVRVRVAPGPSPMVLVLASYESVTWVVDDGGRKLQILLSGYSPSRVMGTQAPVQRIGSAYAYKIDSSEYARLKQDVARYVGGTVSSFQGAYQGREFTVY